MKKILLSIVAGLALASCGSMQQAAAPSASTSAPAKGLFLTDVIYPENIFI